MTHTNSDYQARQLKRWTRPDAHRFVRPDWRRFVRPGFERDHPFALCERKYSADQPRVPAGDPAGGQWTSAGGSAGRNDPRVISDATPDPVRQGAQYAQRVRGAFGSVRINGQFLQPTPGQLARLSIAEGQAQDAIRRVQNVDPNWKPQPSTVETVEGQIQAYQAATLRARARIGELQTMGMLPGRCAVDSFLARSPERNYTTEEVEQNYKNGLHYGCHTCETFEPGTLSARFVLDHQPPSSLKLARPAAANLSTMHIMQRAPGWVRKSNEKAMSTWWQPAK
jgi:hypothetical protein